MGKMLATNTGRVELREGRETMHPSRIHATSTRVAVLFVAAVVAAILGSGLSVHAASAQGAGEQTITADGIGDAVLGLTADELASALGPEFELGDEVRITVDFNGRVVSRDGQVQFRAAMTDGGDELTLFIVSNSDYATAEGVGPTSTIAEAEAIYGDATLSWNPDNEGREFVSFANGPDGRIAFRTPGIGGTNVGVYADGEFETSDYEDRAAIAAVWVSCVVGTDCPQDRAAVEPTSTPDPTATPEPTATPDPTATPEPTATTEPAVTVTPAPGDGTGTGGDGDLPRTGTTELISLSIVAVLFVLGGALMLVERRYLCPAWLAPRGLPVEQN